MSSTKKKQRPAPTGLDAAFASLGSMSKLLDTESSTATEPSGDKLKLAIEHVHADPDQPRRKFDDAALAELADSIRAQGVIQPIVVRPHPDLAGQWMIVSGERRWRASQLAGMAEIPAVQDERAPSDRLLVQIVENVQRSDLDPIELVLAYGRLRDEYGLNASEIARNSGKSKQVVGEYLAVLEMPEPYRNALETGAVRDVSALNALWRKRDKHPQQVAAMLASATQEKPITRALVRQIGEDAGSTAAGESTAAVLSGADNAQGHSPARAPAPGPDGSAGAGADDAGSGDDAGGERKADAGAASEPPKSSNKSASDPVLPVQIRVRHDGEDYTVRYDKQRKVGDQVQVLLATGNGVTIYAPLADLTVLEISRLQH